MENENKIKLFNLYTLREIATAYKVKYNSNKPHLAIKYLQPYVTIEKVPNTVLYIIKEIKIRPEDME